MPPGEKFTIFDYPHIFFSSNENVGSQITDRYNNDQKASVDIALEMPSLSKISPFMFGKIYGEWGGNDINAFWQSEDHKWVWPLGFKLMDIGWLAGLFLTTGNVDLRFENTNQIYAHPAVFDIEYAQGPNNGPSHGRYGG